MDLRINKGSFLNLVFETNRRSKHEAAIDSKWAAIDFASLFKKATKPRVCCDKYRHNASSKAFEVGKANY